MIDQLASVFGQFIAAVSGSALAFVLAVLSPVIAAFSLWVSARTSRRQQALQSQDLVFQFDQALREWGKDAIDAVVALEAAAYQNDQSDFTRQISRVSGAIDKGRMLLPNEPLEKIGGQHPSDSLHRPPVLEGLYAIYDHGARIEPAMMGPDAARALFVLRRAFISELVRVLDTKQKRAVFQRLDDSVRAHLVAVPTRRSPGKRYHMP